MLRWARLSLIYRVWYGDKTTFLIIFLTIAEYILIEPPIDPRIGVIFEGAFEDVNENDTENFLFAYVELMIYNHGNENVFEDHSSIISEVRVIPLVPNLNDIDRTAEQRRSIVFDINQKAFEAIHDLNTTVCLRLRTNIDESLPLQIAYDPSPIDKVTGVIYASIVLLGLYIMIIWEIVHRTFAAMIASTLSIAILAYMNERPTMPDIMSWIDVETLLLLFGMMILVAILSETGIFDYLAVYAYKVSDEQLAKCENRNSCSFTMHPVQFFR